VRLVRLNDSRRLLNIILKFISRAVAGMLMVSSVAYTRWRQRCARAAKGSIPIAAAESSSIRTIPSAVDKDLLIVQNLRRYWVNDVNHELALYRCASSAVAVHGGFGGAT
jgi:CO dehydrogenase/acetyl-CoA synthase epsilon subunit